MPLASSPAHAMFGLWDPPSGSRRGGWLPLAQHTTMRLALRATSSRLMAATPRLPAAFLSEARRAFSSRPPTAGGRGGDLLDEQTEAIEEKILGRLRFGEEKIEFRKPPPPPPSNFAETWVPRSRVSAIPDENALTFRTRYYTDSTMKQPVYANKVQLTVRVPQLGLSELERNRLIAVAGTRYNRKREEQLLTCTRHAETPLNKVELRRTLSGLLADARENAEAHAATPDSEQPFAARRIPWHPGDPGLRREGGRAQRFKGMGSGTRALRRKNRSHW